MKKKTIFLTGASGNMGKEGLKQILSKGKYNVVCLVLPTEKDKKIMAEYKGNPAVKIIWGDLTNYDDVFKGITGSDYVLHVGGMVSPAADYNAKLTTKVNVGAAQNIVKAIKSQPNPDAIKLVYIGTVAQTGDRNPSIHWGRAGDPIKISIFDNYALSKTLAEREIMESGLKYWVSLRQTGILYPEMLNNLDPIMFHEPMDGVFEWVTAKDSGRMLANVCEDTVPDKFWRKVYNIGGGEKYRTQNYDYMQRNFKVLGMKLEKVLDLNWFALRNFHGQWYLDSDILNDYLNFRSGSVDEFLQEFKEKLPFSMKLAKFAPSFIIKNFVFKPVANHEFGTLYWLKNNVNTRITSFFGSKEAWKKIPKWRDYKPADVSGKPIILDHGYDENKDKSELTIEDMRKIAEFRGGKCLSETMTKGDLYTKLQWECAFGHKFELTPAAIIYGGHWCAECLPTPWNYDEEAKRNPFFAQVWYPLHDKNEHNVYTKDILK